MTQFPTRGGNSGQPILLSDQQGFESGLGTVGHVRILIRLSVASQPVETVSSGRKFYVSPLSALKRSVNLLFEANEAESGLLRQGPK